MAVDLKDLSQAIIVGDHIKSAELTRRAIGEGVLPADIINNGVAKGDTGYIIRIGGLMLGVTVALGIASIIAVYWAAKVSMAVP